MNTIHTLQARAAELATAVKDMDVDMDACKVQLAEAEAHDNAAAGAASPGPSSIDTARSQSSDRLLQKGRFNF